MGKYIAKRIGYMALVFLIVSFFDVLAVQPDSDRPCPRRTGSAEAEPQAGGSMSSCIRSCARRWVLTIRWSCAICAGWVCGRMLGTTRISTDCFRATSVIPSSTSRTVIKVISVPMQNTIFINIFSTILALGITIPLGIFCAVHKGKKVDNTVQVVTMLGYSLPIYIIALIFMFFFCVLWRIFPIPARRRRARFTRPSGTSLWICFTTLLCRLSS